MKTTNSSQIAQSLELLAGHIEALKLPPEVAAAQLREFAKRLNQKRPGRPPGAKTKADTPGFKRSMEYLDMTEIAKVKPSLAARIIAEKHGITEEAVFNYARRHKVRAIEEAEREADEVHWELAQTVMSMYPDVFEKFMGEFRDAGDRSASKLGVSVSPLVESMWREKLPRLERELVMILSDHLCELHDRRRNTTNG